MGKTNNIYQLRHIASAVVMLLALAWLTVSLPYVNKAQMDQKQVCQQTEKSDATQDDDNPLTNTTEEKNESGANTLSEYLHDVHLLEQHVSVLVSYYKCHPSDLYFAYHPELLSPPPEA